MSRALTKYFGVQPDLDIEEQRAVVVLERPMPVDWHVVGELIKRGNYTLAAIHLRARGTVLDDATSDHTCRVFQFDASGQRIRLQNSRDVPVQGRTSIEIVGRVEDWDTKDAAMVLLQWH